MDAVTSRCGRNLHRAIQKDARAFSSQPHGADNSGGQRGQICRSQVFLANLHKVDATFGPQSSLLHQRFGSGKERAVGNGEELHLFKV